MTTPTLKSIAQTVIRGEPAVKFPLVYNVGKERIEDANNHLILRMVMWMRLRQTETEQRTTNLQEEIGQCLVDIINREAKAQELY
jgi:hypothetical protein